MTSISSDHIVNVPSTKIDPNFFLPPGVVGVVYADIDERDIEIVETDDGVTATITYDDEVSVPDSQIFNPDIELQPPVSAVVVPPQTLYVAPDGRFAVDVVLEVEDIAGVTNYDIRVSKV